MHSETSPADYMAATSSASQEAVVTEDVTTAASAANTITTAILTQPVQTREPSRVSVRLSRVDC